MNVEIEAAHFPAKENINGIFLAVHGKCDVDFVAVQHLLRPFSSPFFGVKFLDMTIHGFCTSTHHSPFFIFVTEGLSTLVRLSLLDG
jgi:hypothetical protein